MKITVIGGTGLIGRKLVEHLVRHEHEVVAASRATGVDTISGEGLAEAVKGADAVVDVTRAPSFEEAEATRFFAGSTGNLLAAEATARVGHHVALSIVGIDRLAEHRGYFRAKCVQERLIRNSSVPFSIVRATQFFEFITTIADFGASGGAVRLAPVLMQPVAADDVAAAVACVAVGAPVNGILGVAGPNRYRLDELVRRRLAARNDPRVVVSATDAGYFGVAIGERDLIPGDGARIGEIRFEDWLRDVDER